jgi:undecaprenyl-phosphate glucose phosphotransferase
VVAKALQDKLVALAALALLWPVMLAIAVGVKLSSPGPVFFRQRRHGLGGREFYMYKFRSMRVQQEPSDVVVQAKRGDSRVTPFGAFLRRSSLDELPQLFNVLGGSMSVVGPRPHAAQHNTHYEKLINHYMQRHYVKPGITGWAQVNGFRGETPELRTMKKRIQYDLDYIRRWSLWLDTRIIVLTAVKVLGQKTAY